MKATPTYQKLRGGYYTPAAIADFLARWAVQSPTAQILEPSCGDGSCLEAATHALLELGAERSAIANLIHGVEIEALEAQQAERRLQALGIPQTPEQIHRGDFFTYCETHLLEAPFFTTELSAKRSFGAIIGNPPFIRYQNFPKQYERAAFELMRHAGLHPNRLTNAWVPFLVVSTLLLRERGRLAMVIPAELLQVNYASEIREFLSRSYRQITLVTFRGLVFDDIQQEVVLLLADRNGHKSHGIKTLELDGIEELSSCDVDALRDLELKPISCDTEKWTQYFLSTEEILLLRSLRSNTRLTTSGRVIDVDVGIVTGDNEFFALTKQAVEARSLDSYVQPIISRSNHLQGILLSHTDWLANAAKQAPVYLFMPAALPFVELPKAVRAYIAEGESRAVNRGYKCRIRTPWYKVRSGWAPDAFMLRQVHGYPKIVLNETSASCTDTVHRVRFRPGVDGRLVAAAFVNSLTFAFAELTGRSYGGGVLTFEPSEAESLPLPLAQAERIDFEMVHELMRDGRIDAALDVTDAVLLVNGLGMTTHEARVIRDIWKKLRDRRINRNHKNTHSLPLWSSSQLLACLEPGCQRWLRRLSVSADGRS